MNELLPHPSTYCLKPPILAERLLFLHYLLHLSWRSVRFRPVNIQMRQLGSLTFSISRQWNTNAK
jgi:hypothetical protein